MDEQTDQSGDKNNIMHEKKSILNMTTQLWGGKQNHNNKKILVFWLRRGGALAQDSSSSFPCDDPL